MPIGTHSAASSGIGAAQPSVASCGAPSKHERGPAAASRQPTPGRREAQGAPTPSSVRRVEASWRPAAGAGPGTPAPTGRPALRAEAVRGSIAALHPGRPPEEPGANAHDDLADAIARRDPEAASRAAWQHTRTVEEALSRIAADNPGVEGS
ncbi:hypothetical protein [Streptomyces sp. NPDC058385]|uniref:hypothetical protein n=1 Tax=Streptomyces sp. NPDC058385 TaxID=3346473 RepID=UPI00364A9C4C